MPTVLASPREVVDFFGHNSHVRGQLLQARHVGTMPPLVKGGLTLLRMYDVWDFLIRTPNGRFIVVRGEWGQYGQLFGGGPNARDVAKWWTQPKKAATETFKKLAQLPEPVSRARGGGAMLGGQWIKDE